MRMKSAVVAAAVLLSGLSIGAQSGTAPQTRRPLKIGIIGSGAQGGSLGLLFAQAGHEVLFSSRHPEELKDLVAKAGPKTKAGLPDEAAKFGDVVLIAVPYGVLEQIGKDYAALMKGKVVIELGNPREDRDGPLTNQWLAKGVGITSAGFLPGVRLVRAFNALSATQVQKDAWRQGEKLGIPVAGDDNAAVDIAAQLATDAGFDPVVTGNLASSKLFDRNTPVYVKGMTAKQIRDTLKLSQ